MANDDTWGGFTSVDDTQQRLAQSGYLTTPKIATAIYLAASLGKPLLVEGPAGVGKTELAKAAARATGSELIRLQCYEGLDEARALYEWNYKKQLLRIQAATDDTRWDAVHDDIFSEEFLLARPLLSAIRRTEPTVLLVDETDKADVEMEGLLLEVLADFQVTVPELGTIVAERRPFVVLTSNATRDLSEALKRRCLYLHIGYPTPERERDIILSQVPEAGVPLATAVARLSSGLRKLDLRKPPSIAETIDWTRALAVLGSADLDAQTIEQTLGVVLKNETDHERAAELLGLNRR